MRLAAKIETVFPLAAAPSLAENSRLGFSLPTAALHPGFDFAISNTATEFDAALYDFRGGPLSSAYFRDSETSLDYAINRYHQPGMGRFLSTDPKRSSAHLANPGTWNRYAYVAGDPVNRTDRSGKGYQNMNGGCSTWAIEDYADYGSADGPCADSNDTGCDAITNSQFDSPDVVDCNQGGDSTEPPPLSCDYSGSALFPGATYVETGAGPNGSPFTAIAYSVQVYLSFVATGGTGSYTWAVSQLITQTGTLTYSNGDVLQGSNVQRDDYLLPTELTQSPGTAVFNDLPGLWEFENGNGKALLTSGGWQDSFETIMTVTSGNQKSTCNVSWTATFSYVYNAATGSVNATGQAVVNH